MRCERKPAAAGSAPTPSPNGDPDGHGDDGTETQGISRAEIGRRLRAVRLERDLTLRQVAAAAGLSATHISEIERGRTMPTIGALVRLARALGRSPGVFLEARWLPEVSLVRAADPKPRLAPGVLGGGAEVMTRGIPGGALVCARLVVGEGTPSLTCGGELGGFVLRGTARIRVGDGEILAESGDGFHLRAETPATIAAAPPGSAEVLILLSEPATE
jgi:DNA-binding XRE family transcriptional regulator